MSRLHTMLSLVVDLPPVSARRALTAIVAAESRSIIDDFREAVASAFERDMQPVRTAIASAMHGGDMMALQGLRRLLPGLLREVNQAPKMAVKLGRVMALALAEGDAVRAANGTDRTDETYRVGEVLFNDDRVVTTALNTWRKREVFETDMGSAELRGLWDSIRNRSIFSARTTNAEYLGEVANVVDEILAGNIGMTEGRIRLMRKLKQLGYDPAVGFPQDMAEIPPAERDSLQDLSSEQRIDLLLETNVRMAQGYAQVVAGNGDYARYAYPAYELKRLYTRTVERGSPESNSVGWDSRWHDAGESVDWVGAIEEPKMALKDSPIWPALGEGEGGYTDTLRNPFPPFAFRSGLGWKAVDRDRATEAGLISEEERPMRSAATLTPGQQEVARVIDDMPADLRAELERELAEA